MMTRRATRPESAEETVRDIRRATRRQYSAEEKIRIVLEGLRGEASIAELCRKEAIAQSMYYGWSKEFLEAGKRRLAGDTAREATSDEVKSLRAEARQLKEALAEATLENRLLKKKRDRGWGGYRMRYPASEKLEIIRTVETSPLPVRQTLAQIGIAKSTFYAWLDRYAVGGLDALEDRKPRPARVWNRIRDDVRQTIITFALDQPELSPREIATAFTERERTYVSEASVYRLLRAEGLITSPAFIVMKAADRFANPTTAVNQLWQTDFTYLKVTGWGWYYLSTVLDDFSRYIVAWKLCPTMAAADVTATLDLALQASGLDAVDRRPRLLSDNGPSYLATELADWLAQQGMSHTRGKPYHPMTQGKIERWHLSLKSRILLENYYLPGDLERAVAAFVEHYNHRRYHESLDNLTPADVYFGRGARILATRREIKRRTIAERRRLHFQQAA
ncbi:MAG TPA: IS3 family transposase [Steroidobacteraceae bacterium]|nr:IS3 family transposase [Steroidobacteraceae bacterium]